MKSPYVVNYVSEVILADEVTTRYRGYTDYPTLNETAEARSDD